MSHNSPYQEDGKKLIAGIFTTEKNLVDCQ